jgi:hypothetical protein
MAILILLMLSAGLAFGQAEPIAPDCGPWYFQTSAAGSSTVVLNGAGDNRFQGCSNWTVRYASTGFTGLTLTFQSAPGSTAIGTWVTFAGTTETGGNPMTNTVGAESTFSNPTTGAISFVRLTLSGLTGSGTVSAMFYGYREWPTGGGGGSGCTNPCVVIGPEAPGAPATEDPVQVSGVDPSGDVTRILLDAAGRTPPTLASVAGADGVSNTVATPTTEAGAQLYNRIFPYWFNGTTNDRQFSCTNTLPVSVAATGPTEVIPLTAGQTIRVCNFTVSVDTGGALDVSFVYGTGADCGTGTTTIAGPYDQITSFGPTFTAQAPLTIPAGNALCLTNSAATALTGVVIYAKF